MKAKLGTFLTTLSLTFSVLTFASRLGQVHWVLDLLSHYHIQYSVGLVACLGGLLLLKRVGKPLLIPLLALLLNLALVLPFFVPTDLFGTEASADSSTPATIPIRVMALNISTSNAGYNKVVELIRQRQPDIIFMSEVRSDLVSLLQEQLATEYPYLHAEPSRVTLGIAFLSRYPFRKVETVAAGTESRMRRQYLRAELDWQGEAVTVVGIHPLPPMDGSWADSRNRELQLMGEVANQSTEPFILLGDLNASPWSQPMQQLIAQTNLRYAAKGYGLGLTWRLAGVLLGAPLDHILVSPQWDVVDYVEAGNIGSDHIPIQADLRIVTQ
ncbi:MAG: endonuclease/exonuclease/phosphatase family protein [Caldilineaceae bacterium]